ncbi:hypothetical protein [Shimia sp. SDUM112013]|uniref:hypothetical protein n=1 Tax=Shimia sp. SDUM112013 TaxID=3136160 RepID=UPI0032EF072D
MSAMPLSTWIAWPRSVAALGALALFLLTATTAQAEQDWTGPLGRHTTFYGLLSPSYVSVDDGADRSSLAVDAAQNPSRFGFRTRKPGRAFGFRFETGLGTRQSDGFSQTTTPDPIDLTKEDIRWLEVSWNMDETHTLSVGQGAMASHDAAGSDLSGTDMAINVSVPDMAGGIQFRSAGGALSGIAVGDVYKTFDGLRRVRLRYDNQITDALQFSIAAGSGRLQNIGADDVFDTGFYYSAARGTFDVQASVGLSHIRPATGASFCELVGSASVLHRSSGWNLTLSGGFADPGGTGIYAKFGRKLRWLPWGVTALSIDHILNADTFGAGTSATAWGAAIVQHLDRPNVDIFLGLRRYDSRTPSLGTLQTVTAYQIGALWRF